MKVVRDRWGGEIVVLHRGLDQVVAMLSHVEWDKLMAELAEQRAPVATKAKPLQRWD